MELFDANALLDALQHHLDCTHMSVCSSVDECRARRDEIQYTIELVKAQPPVEVKLRTNEDILGVDEAIETINRLRKAYRAAHSGVWEPMRNSYEELEGWIHTDCGRTTQEASSYYPSCGARMSTKRKFHSDIGGN